MSLTKAQEDAVERAYKELHEHFDSAVIAVMAEFTDETDQPKEATRFYWSGGQMAAIGLAYEAARMFQGGRGNPEEETA